MSEREKLLSEKGIDALVEKAVEEAEVVVI